jgi:hypothetical protein
MKISASACASSSSRMLQDTMGSICLLFPARDLLLAGDTLFAGKEPVHEPISVRSAPALHCPGGVTFISKYPEVRVGASVRGLSPDSNY